MSQIWERVEIAGRVNVGGEILSVCVKVYNDDFHKGHRMNDQPGTG